MYIVEPDEEQRHAQLLGNLSFLLRERPTKRCPKIADLDRQAMTHCISLIYSRRIQHGARRLNVMQGMSPPEECILSTRFQPFDRILTQRLQHCESLCPIECCGMLYDSLIDE